MAFQAKVDYCGLATTFSSALGVRDDNDNATNEVYAPTGQDGSIIATEVYGDDSAPTNSYGVIGDLTASAGDLELNAITTIDGKKYALEQVQITTSGGSAPTVSATCQEIESSATDAGQCKYEVPAFTLSPKHHAQILFSAFTLTGTGCSLTDCSATIGGTINKDKIAGVKIGSDINSGLITVSGTVLQTGSTPPTIAAASGWVLTKKPSCSTPETAYKSWTFEIQKALTKTAPSS